MNYRSESTIVISEINEIKNVPFLNIFIYLLEILTMDVQMSFKVVRPLCFGVAVGTFCDISFE